MPSGFTVTTEVCTYYYANKRTYPAAPPGADRFDGIANIEKIMGYKFGDATGFPLLVAVRFGARHSMPAMMDTILNLGLNDDTVLAPVRATPATSVSAWDCYRCFIQMYGDVVLRRAKTPRGRPRAIRDSHRKLSRKSAYHNHQIEDTKLTVSDLKGISSSRFKSLVKERTSATTFPPTRGNSPSRAPWAPCSVRG